jgi:hypothetical protein
VHKERASLPKRNSKDELVFEDYPDFRPNLTPQQVFEVRCAHDCTPPAPSVSHGPEPTSLPSPQLGAFSGGYYRPIKSRVTGKAYQDAHKEFPSEWFKNVDVAKKVKSILSARAHGLRQFPANTAFTPSLFLSKR